MDRKRPVLGGSVRFPQYLGWSWTGCSPRLPVLGAKNRTVNTTNSQYTSVLFSLLLRGPIIGMNAVLIYLWQILCQSNGLARYHIIKEQGNFSWGPKMRFDWLDKLDAHLPLTDVVLSISSSAIMMAIHAAIDAILPCFNSKVDLVWLAVRYQFEQSFFPPPCFLLWQMQKVW